MEISPFIEIVIHSVSLPSLLRPIEVAGRSLRTSVAIPCFAWLMVYMVNMVNRVNKSVSRSISETHENTLEDLQ